MELPVLHLLDHVRCDDSLVLGPGFGPDVVAGGQINVDGDRRQAAPPTGWILNLLAGDR